MKNPFFYNERRMRPGWRALFFLVSASALLVTGSALLFPSSPDRDAPLTLDELLKSGAAELVAVLIASLVFVLSVDRRPWATVGLTLNPSGLREFLMGLLIGSVLISLIFAVTVLAGAVQITGTHFGASVSAQLGIGLLVFLISAVAEELALRGYLFQTLLEGIGVYPTIALTSVLFAVLHTANPNVNTLALVNVALAGFLLAVAYLRTKALWLPIGIHFAWNVLQVHLFSLPVSGLEVPPKLLEVQATGSVLLTGGAFGLEGSSVTTIVLATATFGLLMLPWLKPNAWVEQLWNMHLQPAKRGGELP